VLSQAREVKKAAALNLAAAELKRGGPAGYAEAARQASKVLLRAWRWARCWRRSWTCAQGCARRPTAPTWQHCSASSSECWRCLPGGGSGVGACSHGGSW
jgi:hypothetical protein